MDEAPGCGNWSSMALCVQGLIFIKTMQKIFGAVLPANGEQ